MIFLLQSVVCFDGSNEMANFTCMGKYRPALSNDMSELYKVCVKIVNRVVLLASAFVYTENVVVC